MKKVYLTLICTIILIVSCCCSDDNNDAPGAPYVPIETTYKNPVYASNVADPTIIRGRDGYFYVFATEDIANTPIFRSKDLVTWTFHGTAFTSETRPSFEPDAGIWAPDISYINEQYVLHYSMSKWGGGETCGIGVATAASPTGPFRDNGMLFRSNEIGVHNSIDPFYIEDEGKKYLFWGSFFGIYYIELTDDGLELKYGSVPQQVAGRAFEAVYIHKKNNYYYMFASIGSCCEEEKSTYQLVVGRSESLFGPYVDKEGRDMMDNAYELVIDKNEQFVGNGHCSEIVQDDAGNDWILYHGIDLDNKHYRVLLLDQVKWVDGWPVINDGTPSLEAEKPYFE